MKTFTLKSQTLGGNFEHKHTMDSFGCSGANISPDLFWENAPEGTKSFALVMHDKDAPTPSGFYHWAVFNMPNTSKELAENAGNPEKNLLSEGSFMGRNDAGIKSYKGPCPPEGDFIHQYIFTVYALDVEKVEFDSDTPLAQCVFQMVAGHEIGRASLVAYWKR